jgi:molybdopterin-guanine dinucleotide biosynthesis protein A
MTLAQTRFSSPLVQSLIQPATQPPHQPLTSGAAVQLDITHITGVVLAGGQGSRMGGVDKGRQLFRGLPLAEHAVRRLSPQVGGMLISANRHLDAYAMLAPVVSDSIPGFAGPLAGILAALRAARTPLLACVPCDAPFFPMDLVARLSVPFSDPACEISIAVAPSEDTPDDALKAAVENRPEGFPENTPVTMMRAHPVFALMRTTLADSLEIALAAGERRVNTWRMRHNAVEVAFPDKHAFYNVNTLAALDAAS